MLSNNLRYDLQLLSSLICTESKILDIGCGEGDLLYFLQQQKKVQAFGLEISQNMVSKAIIKGLSVIQGNAESDLSIYPDQSFDYAILSQTIQATHNPPQILQQMLRISRYAIVSLPNFAFIQNRLHLLLKGEMPINKNIPYQWYETPNIHFCSIKDFTKLCHDLNFNIEQKIFTSYNKTLKYSTFANLFAQYGIFLLSKPVNITVIQQDRPFIANNSLLTCTQNSCTPNKS
jgi:methionine biosynthesis protein MetW